MVTYLDDIVAHHRERARGDRRSEPELVASLEDAPPIRPFVAALADCASASRLAVIAEVKRRSPIAGELAIALDPADLARNYALGGAACLSVLTDGPHFGGSPEDLLRAREASGLPVLRKDFTVSRADCFDARAMGADAVLLIAAVLDDEELVELHELATALGLAALVEVHDEAELDRALAIGATLVGVNQRDLRTFAVDRERAARLGAAIPDGVLAVAESGLRTPADADRLAAAGYRAVLVGEALVISADPAAAVAGFARELRSNAAQAGSCS